MFLFINCYLSFINRIINPTSSVAVRGEDGSITHENNPKIICLIFLFKKKLQQAGSLLYFELVIFINRLSFLKASPEEIASAAISIPVLIESAFPER